MSRNSRKLTSVNFLKLDNMHMIEDAFDVRNINDIRDFMNINELKLADRHGSVCSP